jgi:tetratricopeptide (TPR) repeat protein
MRSRLMVDLANLLTRQRKYSLAFRLYRLSLSWWPDASSRLIVLCNRGAAELHSGQIETAIHTLEGVLETQERPRLGLKYEAAAHYNLGFAYELNKEDARATAEYNETIEALPGSLYAQAAQAALKRRRNKQSGG